MTTKTSDYYNILSKKNDVLFQGKTAQEVAIDLEKDKNTKEAIAVATVGLVAIVALVGVILLCIVMRDNSPYYGWRRYYW